MALCGGRGIRDFAGMAMCAAAKERSPWFYLFCPIRASSEQGKGSVRKEAFWLT